MKQVSFLLLVILLFMNPLRSQEHKVTQNTVSILDLQVGKVTITGRLGVPIAKPVIISGEWKATPALTVISEGVTFQVNKVDGEKLDSPVNFEVSEMSSLSTSIGDAGILQHDVNNLPKGQCEMIAYEGIRYFGTPKELYEMNSDVIIDPQGKKSGYYTYLVVCEKNTK